MKTIFSLKVSSHRFGLSNLIELYKFCQSCSSSIYIYVKDKSCKVEHLPSLVSFMISLEYRDLMIVVEGENSLEDKGLLEELIKKSNDPIKARGLH
ncbi:hypothetical protein ACJROX_26315 [Pseudalkalibacillus sp. A8]|uniref:hypothetical protein n=1 Tax=Pseudalkalibacillus sp. A8 TaxID=3382641 RepID=UPI0038B588EC